MFRKILVAIDEHCNVLTLQNTAPIQLHRELAVS
jgi:hypothetical protein